MRDCRRVFTGTAAAVLLVLLAFPAAAQIEDQISVYTGANAESYLTPLSNAVGTTLNTGFFRSAYLPVSGFHIGLELLVSAMVFDDGDRTFDATTEGSFLPQQTQTVPTVIGSGSATMIDGASGTSYAFPGGFDLNSFGMLAPQLRLSSLHGTELVGRYAKVKSGDADIGDVTLYGVGIRHNISQYFREDFPVDMSVGGIYQKFTAGENNAGGDLMSTDLLSIGVNASKRFPIGFATFEPYTALSYDTFETTLEYANEVDGPQSIDFDQVNSAHWTLGLNLNLIFANVYAEYNLAKTQSFGVGLALGYLGY